MQISNAARKIPSTNPQFSQPFNYMSKADKSLSGRETQPNVQETSRNFIVDVNYSASTYLPVQYSTNKINSGI